jgi:hypothetical protein
MGLSQLEQVHHWHLRHRQPVEHAVFATVTAIWLSGWVTLPLAVLLVGPTGALASALLIATPAMYGRTRRALHLRGRLRCDWLCATRS